MSRTPLHLLHHPEDLAVARLDGGVEPQWDWRGGPYSSLTVGPTETSVVCLAETVPDDVTSHGPFHGFEVAGPLDFDLVGVLHSLLDPLVKRGISVVAMSTYDTDWLLVPGARTEETEAALRRDGCLVTTPRLGGSAA